ncbi:hypothetical protein BDN70DRAFT_902296 [Pholiota conissans]|uniref:Uncharacterized protein n=1 Tax=Pholiota conissans TaxID=109636 RepID=A0A9P6CKP3_9AGAR|nr:hypothetical protein BDN70DRAFT_902296 [Pholiota conissans]
MYPTATVQEIAILEHVELSRYGSYCLETHGPLCTNNGRQGHVEPRSLALSSFVFSSPAAPSLRLSSSPVLSSDLFLPAHSPTPRCLSLVHPTLLVCSFAAARRVSEKIGYTGQETRKEGKRGGYPSSSSIRLCLPFLALPSASLVVPRYLSLLRPFIPIHLPPHVVGELGHTLIPGFAIVAHLRRKSFGIVLGGRH